MEIRDRRVLILGGSGLVGGAVARALLPHGPARIALGGLHREEAEMAADALREEAEAAGAEGVQVVPVWGDVFVREDHEGRPRESLLVEPERRAELLEDVFGPLDEDAFARSRLVALLTEERPQVVVDCINTATAIAYQDIFASVASLRRGLAAGDGVAAEQVERHLSTLYLPQLIRHVQLLLEGLRRAGTGSYVKVGTSGTGGMGLNVPFTHSEERPSRTLLAKASVAGAHSLLLFLMGRTPDAPAVAEVKPAAAVAWNRIGFGPIRRGGAPMRRWDAERPLALGKAFGPEAAETWAEADGPLESVFLDAGENGLFSLSEFEAISALRLMEVITPEEIADAVLDAIRGRPTGHDVVGALDAAVMGPTYRGGMLREVALAHMERLEAAHGVRSVAFEMLGPPRLSKLLFEAALLERLLPDLDGACGLDPEETAREAEALVLEDARLRSDMLSVGIPILLPDGKRLFRGPEVKVEPPNGDPGPVLDRLAAQGWVDLRPGCWVQWRERCRRFRDAHPLGRGPEAGSRTDLDLRSASGEIRAGALAAFVFRYEDGGERIKR